MKRMMRFRIILVCGKLSGFLLMVRIFSFKFVISFIVMYFMLSLLRSVSVIGMVRVVIRWVYLVVFVRREISV